MTVNHSQALKDRVATPKTRVIKTVIIARDPSSLSRIVVCESIRVFVWMEIDR